MKSISTSTAFNCSIFIGKLSSFDNKKTKNLHLLYNSTLTKVYHFNEKTWSNLRFATYINEAYLGWVLGFMISESNAIPREEPLPEILLETNFYTIPVSILLIVIVICAICFGRQFKKKPQDNSSSLPMTQVA